MVIVIHARTGSAAAGTVTVPMHASPAFCVYGMGEPERAHTPGCLTGRLRLARLVDGKLKWQKTKPKCEVGRPVG